MSPVGSVYPSLTSPALGRIDAPLPKLPTIGLPGQAAGAPATEGFGQMLDGLVSTVGTKQAEATAITRKVLLGDSDQIHQSVIAMQEASVAFSMMVEVRNKLVDSYQELMRMQT
jgi:flagellar hook-basal body complex protein FliE